MQPVLNLLERIGPSEATVLITGENGTGKGLVARLLHAASSCASRPFLNVNAGGLSEGVLESELFGHVRGAFTDARADRAGRFELADGGTLFLDEIGNAPASLQARLLRVLESGEFERVGSSRNPEADVRILSATNANLDDEIASGRFRQDLRYRLNTMEIVVPPLRDRREDIAPLAAHLPRTARRALPKGRPGFEDAALRLLEQHSLAGERPRARPRRRAGRPHGEREPHRPLRPSPRPARFRCAESRRAEPRGDGRSSDSEGSCPVRKRHRRRSGPRPLP